DAEDLLGDVGGGLRGAGHECFPVWIGLPPIWTLRRKVPALGWGALPLVREPGMGFFHAGARRSTIAVPRGPEAETLLDQATGQVVERRVAARALDSAIRGAPFRRHEIEHLHAGLLSG